MKATRKAIVQIAKSKQTYILLGIFASLLIALRVYYYNNPQHYVPNEYMRLVWTAVILLSLFLIIGIINLRRFYADPVFRRNIKAKTIIEKSMKETGRKR